MAGAFQASAFQRFAFQTDAAALPVVGSSISGGTFSRKRWHELKQLLRAEAEAKEAAPARKATTRKAITAAAEAARKIAEAADSPRWRASAAGPSPAINLALVRLTDALDAAAGATSLKQALSLSSAVIEHARRARQEIEAEKARREAEREEEDTIALLLAA
jgi:hypothetical protein